MLHDPLSAFSTAKRLGGSLVVLLLSFAPIPAAAAGNLYGCGSGLGAIDFPTPSTTFHAGDSIPYLARACSADGHFNLCKRIRESWIDILNDQGRPIGRSLPLDLKPIASGSDSLQAAGVIDTAGWPVGREGARFTVRFYGGILYCSAGLFCGCQELSALESSIKDFPVQVQPGRVTVEGTVEIEGLGGVEGLSVEVNGFATGTGPGGRWSLEVPISTPSDSIHAAVRFEDYSFRLEKDCRTLGGAGEVYGMEQSQGGVVPGVRVSFPPFRLTGPAAQLWRLAHEAHKRYLTLTAHTFLDEDQIDLCVPVQSNVGAQYNPSRNELLGPPAYLSSGDDSIYHEMGHAVMDQAYGSVPGQNCSGHRVDVELDRSCSWTEGWANFFALVVKGTHDGILKVSTPRGGGGVGAADFERYFATRVFDSRNEGWVTAALWDLYDTADDGSGNPSAGFGRVGEADRNGASPIPFFEMVNALFHKSKPHLNAKEYLDVLRRIAPQARVSPDIFTSIERMNYVASAPRPAAPVGESAREGAPGGSEVRSSGSERSEDAAAPERGRATPLRSFGFGAVRWDFELVEPLRAVELMARLGSWPGPANGLWALRLEYRRSEEGTLLSARILRPVTLGPTEVYRKDPEPPPPGARWVRVLLRPIDGAPPVAAWGEIRFLESFRPRRD
jgi:hypothetical protein